MSMDTPLPFDDRDEVIDPDSVIDHIDTDEVPEYDHTGDFTDDVEGEANGKRIRSVFGSEREEGVE
jgi:hypothetical protein